MSSDRRISTATSVDAADFTFAFQPIVDANTRSVLSHEAFVRGVSRASAYAVISRYGAAQMEEFDAACRAKAIEVAVKVGVMKRLNLDSLPTAVFSENSGLASTLKAAARFGFPAERSGRAVQVGQSAAAG